MSARSAGPGHDQNFFIKARRPADISRASDREQVVISSRYQPFSNPCETKPIRWKPLLPRDLFQSAVHVIIFCLRESRSALDARRISQYESAMVCNTTL